MSKKVKILHLLLCEWKDITKAMPLIKECGWDGIQICPVAPSKKLYTNNGKIIRGSEAWHSQAWQDWALMYQPTRFNEISSWMGNEYDFAKLCESGDKYGVMIIPDLVLRHCGNDYNNELLPCRDPYEEVDPYILSRPDFFAEPININNYKDRWQQTHRCTHLPMFEYDNEDLQNEILIPFCKKVASYTPHFRLDQMMHYARRDEGSNFLDNVLGVFGEGLHYGECIFTNPEDCKKYYEIHKIMPLVNDYELYGYKNRVAFFQSHDTDLSFLSTLYLNDGYDPNKSERVNKWENLLTQTNFALYFARRCDQTIYCSKMAEINNRYK